MFDLLNRIPVARSLQVIAVLSLVIGIVVAGITAFNMMENTHRGAATVLFVTLSTFIKMLYQPFILLGMAEIIKVLQEGKK